MNRYFIYLVLLNMLTNVIIFIPKILISDEYNGAVMSTLISLPIGIFLCYIYARAFAKFPGKGLPDVLEHSPKPWMRNLYLLGIQILWYTAGLLTLLGFIDILNRYINPEAPKLLILFIYLAAICLIMQMPTERVMFFLEIVLFLNTPLIAFIMFKAFTSEMLNWDSILEVCTHLFDPPSLKSIGASTYIFSGYTNLIIFNRVIKGKLKIWNLSVIFLLGIINLFTTFLIPIGYHGADGTQAYLYPWITTADSLRLVYSPVERVIFLFLMLYMSIALMSVSLHWHVAFELIKGTFKSKVSHKKNWLVTICFMAASVPGAIYLNTVLLHKIASYWFIVRLFFEAGAVITTYIWARRKMI